MEKTIYVNRPASRTWNRLGVNEAAVRWDTDAEALLSSERFTAVSGKNAPLRIEAADGGAAYGRRVYTVTAEAGAELTVFEVCTAAHLQPIVGVACLQAGAVLLHIFHVGLVARDVVLPCLETVARQQLPVLAERPFALRLQFQAVGGLRGAIYGVGEAKQVDVGGIKPPAAGAKGGGEHQSRLVGQG